MEPDLVTDPKILDFLHKSGKGEGGRGKGSVDFLHKSGKGEGGRGKGSVLSPSPLTFTLFPPLAKSTFARGLVLSPSPLTFTLFPPLAKSTFARGLLNVLNELVQREQIFHRPELGTKRADFEQMTESTFWEVGASGRRYSRQYVLDEMEKRYASPE